MAPDQTMYILCAVLLCISFLYSSVGQAGASGYIAAMGLLGLAPDFIRPAALLLNILVASVTAWQFYRAGHFSWKAFWPYAVLSIPGAYAGGWITLPPFFFRAFVGCALAFAALLLIMRQKQDKEIHEPHRAVALGIGGGLGFLAGLTGIGGGVFLAPTLILFRWAKVKTVSMASALFILVNSIAALLGLTSSAKNLPALSVMAPMAAMVVIGGLAGSYVGSRKFSVQAVKIILACVLAAAAIRMIIQ